MNKKILHSDTYSFDASAKTITFNSSSTDDVSLANLLLITNVTDNEIIYNFGCAGFGATVNLNVVTLEYDTTSMSDSDELQIVIYTEQTPNQENTLEQLSLQTSSLECLQEILEEQKKTNMFLQMILK